MEPRKSFLLRIDPALWADIEAWAQDELRSVNGQVEYILKQAMARRKGAISRPAPPAQPTELPPGNDDSLSI